MTGGLLSEVPIIEIEVHVPAKGILSGRVSHHNGLKLQDSLYAIKLIKCHRYQNQYGYPYIFDIHFDLFF